MIDLRILLDGQDHYPEDNGHETHTSLEDGTQERVGT